MALMTSAHRRFALRKAALFSQAYAVGIRLPRAVLLQVGGAKRSFWTPDYPESNHRPDGIPELTGPAMRLPGSAHTGCVAENALPTFGVGK